MKEALTARRRRHLELVPELLQLWGGLGQEGQSSYSPFRMRDLADLFNLSLNEVKGIIRRDKRLPAIQKGHRRPACRQLGAEHVRFLVDPDTLKR